MRTCIITKIISRYRENRNRNDLSRKLFGTKSYSIREFQESCLKDYTGFLVKFMQLEHEDWACRGLPAERKIPHKKLETFCNLGHYPEECVRRRMGWVYSLDEFTLKVACDKLKREGEQTRTDKILTLECERKGLF